MNVYEILSQDAFWQVNKKIAKVTSIEASVLLADLVSKERYFKERGELTEDGFFFNSQKQIEEDTTLTAKVQNARLKQLQKLDFIIVKLMCTPAIKHYKIQHENIIKTLIEVNESHRLAQKEKQDSPNGTNKFSPNGQTSLAQKEKQDSPKGITNKKQYNKKQSNKKQVISIKDISSNEETSLSEEIISIPKNEEEGKEKSSAKKEKPVQLSPIIIEVYYNWYKDNNDGIQPKIDGVEGKAAKTLASYFKAMQTKDNIIYESDGDKVRDLFSVILQKWDKLEPFLQKQVKLSQISSNITNIINNLKNGKQTSYQQSRSINNQESFGSAFDAIDKAWNKP